MGSKARIIASNIKDLSSPVAALVSPQFTGSPTAPSPTSSNGIANKGYVDTALTGYQPLDGDLTSIGGLTGTSGILKKTAANTWTLDTNTYLTGNQSITFTGDATGSGTTSVALTLNASSVLSKLLTVDGVGSGLDADLLDGRNSSGYMFAETARTSADLSTLLTTGHYALNGDNLNSPSQWGNMLTMISADVYSQLVVNHENKLHYRGRSQGGGWQPWVQLYHSGNLVNATTSVAGLMSSTDKTKLDGVAAGATANTGTVTSVVAGTGLSGGTITATGTLSLATSGVTAGSYGSSSAIPVLTVDTYGRITAASTASVSIPSGLTAGSTSSGFLNYSGTTATAGQMNGGTTAATGTTRLNYEGYFYATRSYNAVYNDYAEYFEKADSSLEPGDVVSINPDGEGYVKSKGEYDNLVVGVYSDDYAYCIGGSGDGTDEEKYASVGLAGRVRVKVIGIVNKGDLLVASEIPGVAKAGNKAGCIIAKALESHDGNSINRIKALILNA